VPPHQPLTCTPRQRGGGNLRFGRATTSPESPPVAQRSSRGTKTPLIRGTVHLRCHLSLRPSKRVEFNEDGRCRSGLARRHDARVEGRSCHHRASPCWGTTRARHARKACGTSIFPPPLDPECCALRPRIVAGGDSRGSGRPGWMGGAIAGAHPRLARCDVTENASTRRGKAVLT